MAQLGTEQGLTGTAQRAHQSHCPAGARHHILAQHSL